MIQKCNKYIDKFGICDTILHKRDIVKIDKEAQRIHFQCPKCFEECVGLLWECKEYLDKEK